MTNILALPEVTITMTNPRGDTWMESLQYFYSDGTTGIDLTGIDFDFHLYSGFAASSIPLLSFSTKNYATIVPTGDIKSILAWSVPDYFMKKLGNAPANLDFRCFANADTYRITVMTGSLTLT